ncbi:MAG: alpha/beta hydrolase [Thermoanaerobaculia bacterium]
MSQKSTIGRTLALRGLRAGFAAANALSPELAAAGARRLFLSTRRHPVSTREQAYLQGARRLDLPGPLAAWIWGREGAPTVALLHGWEGRGSQLGAFADPLVAAGFRVVAVDAPGHGDSPGRSSTLVAIADALRRVGERFGPLAGVIAHSAGTVGAVHCVSRGLPVDRLVCVAPGVDLEGYVGEFARIFGLSAAASRSLKLRIERHVGVTMRELDPRRAAPGLRIPLLVIHDRTDREAPFAGGEALARSWPGARLIATEGLGHTRILWDEKVVSAATAFLREGLRMEEADLKVPAMICEGGGPASPWQPSLPTE